MKSGKEEKTQIGAAWVVFFTLAALKLTGNLDWSWLWVTSPVWLDLLMLIAAYAIHGFVHWSDQ